MNERQRKFCKYYAAAPNATAAAISAGYSPRSAYSCGQRMLRSKIISVSSRRKPPLAALRTCRRSKSYGPRRCGMPARKRPIACGLVNCWQSQRVSLPNRTDQNTRTETMIRTLYQRERLPLFVCPGMGGKQSMPWKMRMGKSRRFPAPKTMMF